MIEKLSHTKLATAHEIRAVYQVSYAIEAELLGAADFPPLKRKIEAYTNCENDFYGFIVNDQLAGVIEIDEQRASTHIQSLVVAPQFFRRGIAQELIAHILEIYDRDIFTVETGLANEPAKALYLKNGFVDVKHYDTDHDIRKVRFELKIKSV